jgi:hypothetical protein
MTMKFLYKTLMAISCLNYAILGIMLVSIETCTLAYRRRVVFPPLKLFAVMLCGQSILSMLTDVFWFNWNGMYTTARLVLWSDRLLAIAIGASMFINVFWMRPIDIITCFALGISGVFIWLMDRLALQQKDLMTYVFLHFMWHCIPLVWLVWLTDRMLLDVYHVPL